MPDLFIELFSEEIPARLQRRGAEDFARLLTEALAPLAPSDVRHFHGPRRLALAATLRASVPASSTEERGPRITAPEQALAGFLRKHAAERDALRQQGDFWVLDKAAPAVAAAELVARIMPPLLRRFPWPKSMRWGGGSAFTWIRPLRRILCLLDGAVVSFSLAAEDDDGHRLVSGDMTEGHRVHGPTPFAVRGVSDWLSGLRDHRVIADAAERATLIRDGIAALAASRGLLVVQDDGLVEEVAGLVEWPVPLLGRIDESFMDLPPEVMQVSMRVNQRYFALRDAAGRAAPWFGFAANLDAPDGGAAIVAGNERVLRARFSDARHFWDLDRRTKLEARVAALDKVTFHAKLGSQGNRVRRLVRLAGVIAPLVGADVSLAERAAVLCKADLTTGMVGEFPELQGVMGAYYAQHDNEDPLVAAAARDHYAPKGMGDDVPTEPVSVAVALADKLDQLAAFFSIDERPTGSGDPYALRRAALGVIRIVRENQLRLGLREVLTVAVSSFAADTADMASNILAFIGDRLRVQLRFEGTRHDVLSAVLSSGVEDDLVRALARANAISSLLGTENGRDLVQAYRRAANILRIEERRDGAHEGCVDPTLLTEAEEIALDAALTEAARASVLVVEEHFSAAMVLLAGLLNPLNAFFDVVTVNSDQPELRENRLRLLARLRTSIDEVADFSKLEGE